MSGLVLAGRVEPIRLEREHRHVRRQIRIEQRVVPISCAIDGVVGRQEFDLARQAVCSVRLLECEDACRRRRGRLAVGVEAPEQTVDRRALASKQRRQHAREVRRALVILSGQRGHCFLVPIERIVCPLELKLQQWGNRGRIRARQQDDDRFRDQIAGAVERARAHARRRPAARFPHRSPA